MNSKKSKKLLQKARNSNRVKRGDLIADGLYEQMKKEDRLKKKKQVVKQKISPRQKRLLGIIDQITTNQLRGRAAARGRDNAPKDKPNKF